MVPELRQEAMRTANEGDIGTGIAALSVPRVKERKIAFSRDAVQESPDRVLGRLSCKAVVVLLNRDPR